MNDPASSEFPSGDWQVTSTTESDQNIPARLWALSAGHGADAEVARGQGQQELAVYHDGKAFAYEHAARMIEGTDAS